MQVFCWLNWLGEGKDLRTITFGFIPNTKQVNVYLFMILRILLFDIVVGNTWKFCFFKLRYSWNVCNVKKNRSVVNVVKLYINRMVPPVPCCSLLHTLQLQVLKVPCYESHSYCVHKVQVIPGGCEIFTLWTHFAEEECAGGFGKSVKTDAAMGFVCLHK